MPFSLHSGNKPTQKQTKNSSAMSDMSHSWSLFSGYASKASWVWALLINNTPTAQHHGVNTLIKGANFPSIDSVFKDSNEMTMVLCQKTELYKPLHARWMLHNRCKHNLERISQGCAYSVSWRWRKMKIRKQRLHARANTSKKRLVFFKARSSPEEGTSLSKHRLEHKTPVYGIFSSQSCPSGHFWVKEYKLIQVPCTEVRLVYRYDAATTQSRKHAKGDTYQLT